MAFVTSLAPPRRVGKAEVTRARRGKNVVVAIERQGGHAAADPEAVVSTDVIEYPSPEGPFCELGHLSEVAHLTDYLPDLEVYKNPAAGREFINRYFVDNGDAVMKQVVMNATKPRDMTMYMRAGPRESVYFHPDEVRAAIVSCGGICPGINTVIREVVENLWYEYGVRSIFGVQNGYRGFYSKNWKTMNPEMVDQIHKQGGTILGSSRGGFDCRKIMDALETRGINHVYIIGGDGTIRGANILASEAKKRFLKLSVVSVPKTIDNDIPVIDRSFGFETAVEGALRAINAACVEAQSFPNGLGLVKLMGRNSGFIAMHATLSSRDVDVCLIPEVPFQMDGPCGLNAYVEKRLKERGRCIVVVAEGAGQDIVEDKRTIVRDRSGNRLLSDIGLYLYNELKLYFQQKETEINLKYIDPTYMIRAVPANAADNLYCTMLAHMAVHGAFAGFTAFTIGPVNGFHAYIPLADVTNLQNKVDIVDRNWLRLVASTGQSEMMDTSLAGSDSNGTEPEAEPDFLTA